MQKNENSDVDVSKRVALVTGGSRGIGRAACLKLAESATAIAGLHGDPIGMPRSCLMIWFPAVKIELPKSHSSMSWMSCSDIYAHLPRAPLCGLPHLVGSGWLFLVDTLIPFSLAGIVPRASSITHAMVILISACSRFVYMLFTSAMYPLSPGMALCSKARASRG